MTKRQERELLKQIRKSLRDPDYAIVLNFAVTAKQLKCAFAQAMRERHANRWNQSADEVGCF